MFFSVAWKHQLLWKGNTTVENGCLAFKENIVSKCNMVLIMKENLHVYS